MKLHIILSLILLLLSQYIFPATFDETCNTKPYVSSSMTEWKGWIAKLETEFKKDPTLANKFEWLVNEYGLLSATMKEKNEDVFDLYYDQALSKAFELIDKNHNVAECKALVSGIYGLKIAYSPWRGMFLGPKSGRYINEAVELSPNSPIVQQLYGNYLNFTPETWGGDTEKAIAAYKKAIQWYEQNGDTCWMYLDAHAWLGLMYKETDKKDMALETWNKALSQEPEFIWIRDQLIPRL